MSLPESIPPLDYPILTPLVSFISLCASFEANLIHSWGTLASNDIDHVSIMKSIVPPHKKEVESLAKVTQNMLAYVGIELCQIPILEV